MKAAAALLAALLMLVGASCAPEPSPTVVPVGPRECVYFDGTRYVGRACP